MNQQLLRGLQNWKLLGSKPQAGVDWTSTKVNWISGFSDHQTFIMSLPKVIDRGIVRDICASASNTVLEKFLATMIWGYSDRGYGAFRVSKMLLQSDAKDILSQVIELSNNSRPIEAYAFLKANRIFNLGPSYASKFITFNTPRNVSAPILDSLIVRWLSEFASEEFAGLNLSCTTWNTKTYTAYCDWIGHHANSASCLPDDVELILFRLAEERYAKASSWLGK
jgi:hypothetical protein